ncbi:conserved hypothetical protein [Rhodopseudomonas palustris TIE-1]|uniref:type II toxin-antitoxin system toxin DNA ADP-ribosyl transferase DarT n=1 Tax=Rhodopseudomonas palustris TaxID=1076 RepID=UPI000177967E|nr:DUF4433 domain-containing protein [Rhodopseudomonas palustris]ACF00622.1 conserved hypothetical protein [Rhodopseudomonas palustris TIE-1]
MPPPIPTAIFHITAIANLDSIAKQGALLSKNEAAARGLVAANIAYDHIQGRRAVRTVPIAPGGTLHDYVPFYFAPRSPMLFTINQGNVPDCIYRQDDIVHLATTAQTVADTGQQIVFSDIHAALDYARFFSDLGSLTEIDWRIFFEPPRLEGYCKFWQNRQIPIHHLRRLEIRQAEFLVHGELPIAAISEIGVKTAQAAAQVEQAVAGSGWTPTVRVVPGWYF